MVEPKRTRRNFKKLYPDDAQIRVEVDIDKVLGVKTRARLQDYKVEGTVINCLDLGHTRRLIDSDVQKGYISVQS